MSYFSFYSELAGRIGLISLVGKYSLHIWPAPYLFCSGYCQPWQCESAVPVPVIEKISRG